MLHQIKPAVGSRKASKRVGRGNGSGRGTYSGRGSKGQKSRSKVPLGFEGGQLPLTKRMPALRGFTNKFRIEYLPVNLKSLVRLSSNTEITPELIYQSGLVRSKRKRIKILGAGNVTKPIRITAHAFSATAKNKIENSGGSITLIPDKPHKDRAKD